MHMEEPSVLDYVKSKLTFWKPSTIRIPPPESETEAVSGEYQRDRADVLPETGVSRSIISTVNSAIHPHVVAVHITDLFMVLGCFGLAFIAQSFIEPPNRAWVVALVLYGLSALLIGFAYFRNHLAVSARPGDEGYEALYTLQPKALVVSLIFLVLTFVFFGKGADSDVPRFNILNTSLWILSTAYLVKAFWQSSVKENVPVYQRIQSLWKALLSARISVTRWGLILIAVIAVIGFFRFYRLDSVPMEMVSDHAEKLLDVGDVLNGDLKVFFTRNTGREAFQFYWTALMVKLFNTGISFMALKLGTVSVGLITLVYIYRTGSEIGGRRVAVLAVLFAGFGYWANVQSRIGLRFPLYPFFFAPVLFHLIRALRKGKQNDFIWVGLWLGAGLHGYTSSRIVPLVVLAGVLLYVLHNRLVDRRKYAFWGLLIIALVSLAVFMPLFRFTIDEPGMVALRSLTRISDLERPLPGPAWLIFIQNTWNALVMFFWDDGDVWVHSVSHRPALDVISSALFFLGLVLVFIRYLRKRNWIDLFLLLSIPILLLPSILSLAFPNENPNLNRTAAAYVPVFLILAIGLEALLSTVKRSLPGRLGVMSAGALGLVMAVSSAVCNYDLLFIQYDQIFRNTSWNSSEMGEVIRKFDGTFGSAEDAWVVAYPYWVDTRLVGINAGYPTRDTAINPDDLVSTLENPRAKLFILHPQDLVALGRLQNYYPEGWYWQYPSETPGKEFLIFLAPPQENMQQLPQVVR